VSHWTLVVATIAGCYAEKLLGYLVPARWLSGARALRVLELLPIALLMALVVVELLADGRHIHLSGPALVGFGAGALAPAPFIVKERRRRIAPGF